MVGNSLFSPQGALIASILKTLAKRNKGQTKLYCDYSWKKTVLYFTVQTIALTEEAHIEFACIPAPLSLVDFAEQTPYFLDKVLLRLIAWIFIYTNENKRTSPKNGDLS